MQDIKDTQEALATLSMDKGGVSTSSLGQKLYDAAKVDRQDLVQEMLENKALSKADCCFIAPSKESILYLLTESNHVLSESNLNKLLLKAHSSPETETHAFVWSCLYAIDIAVRQRKWT